MKTIITAFFAVAALVGGLVTVPAFAQENENRFYIAPEIGVVSIKDTCNAARRISQNVSCKNTGAALGFTGGFQFNDFLSAEAGILYGAGFEIGGFALDYVTAPIGMRVQFPVNEFFAVTGKAGIHFWKARYRVIFQGREISITDDGNDPYLGAGAKLSFSDSVDGRVEYTVYKADGYDVDAISASLVFRF